MIRRDNLTATSMHDIYAISDMSVLGLWRRFRWAVRDRWPDRVVERDVQGVRMLLPWSSRIPDYAQAFPHIGQNLIKLAEILHDGVTPLKVLDVGANVGDSALQILDVIDARVLCVEADRYFLTYLERNTANDSRVAVEPVLLSATKAPVAMKPIRSGGTTRFVPGVSKLTAPSCTTDELRKRNPDFASVRLVKTDTDGYDVELIPAIARTWIDCRPVLFFEYDHALSRKAGNDPLAVWPPLVELGYTQVAAWDNFGEPVGRWHVTDVGAALSDPGARAGYWDLAVVHDDDKAGLGAIDRLVPA